MMSQFFCYHCVEYVKLDTCAKFHDEQRNNNKVMMGGLSCPPPPPPLMTDGSKKKPMSNRVKQHNNTCSSSCPCFLLNKSRSSCIFLLKPWEIFSNLNPDSLTKNLGRKPNPGTVRTCESPGVTPGKNGQAWNRLTHNIVP